MITYRELGNMGRLGNQMFQYAALYGAGFMRGYEIGIPDKDLEISKIFKNLSAAKVEKKWSGKRYNEPSFDFNASLWLIEDNMDIVGYFQSPHYWLHCSQQVYDEFEFQDEIVTKGKEWLEKEGLTNLPLCSIHVRRGDYVNLSSYHHNLGMDYYKKGYDVMKQNIENDLSYLVFTDDPEWCKQNFSGAKVVEGNSAAVDLYLMSCCHAHIIANSSFSWWGAFLSLSQAVVAPARGSDQKVQKIGIPYT